MNAEIASESVPNHVKTESRTESPCGIVISRPNSRTLNFVNPLFAKMHGYTIHELKGCSIETLMSPEARKALPGHLKKASQQGHTTFQGVHQRKDGSRFLAFHDITTIKESRNELLFRVVNMKELPDHSSRKAGVKHSKILVKLASLYGQDFLQTLCLFFQRKFSAESVSLFHTLDDQSELTPLVHIGSETSSDFWKRNDDSNSDLFYAFNNDVGELEAVLGLKSDHTYTYDQYQRFKEFASSFCKRILHEIHIEVEKRNLHSEIRQKEILLKETHHRIKNNLSMLCSLLTLQLQEKLPGFDSSEVINPIRTIALIHEKLHCVPVGTPLNAKEYLEDLIEEMIYNAHIPLKLIIEIPAVEMNDTVLLPCGLIINELVTNALKYAFNTHPSPVLQIRLKRLDNGYFLLSVEDNGPGLPPDFDTRECDSLGLLLVKSLAEQLKGTFLNTTKDEGSCFSIKFSAENPICTDHH